jgi:hypothetical protein
VNKKDSNLSILLLSKKHDTEKKDRVAQARRLNSKTERKDRLHSSYGREKEKPTKTQCEQGRKSQLSTIKDTMEMTGDDPDRKPEAVTQLGGEDEKKSQEVF